LIVTLVYCTVVKELCEDDGMVGY